MQIAIPLDRMTVSEKLSALEEIWADLSQTQDAIPSPDWHADVLQVRENKIQEGKAKFLDLDEAKRRVCETKW
jgi:hypothetical protein